MRLDCTKYYDALVKNTQFLTRYRDPVEAVIQMSAATHIPLYAVAMYAIREGKDDGSARLTKLCQRLSDFYGYNEIIT